MAKIELKVGEWKELRKRLSNILEREYDHIPDDPAWSYGTVGFNVQRLRKVLGEIDMRLEAERTGRD